MNETKQPLKVVVYEYIKNNIITCAYAPGSIINEEFIREQINVSRTPIRDALGRLEQEGLVKILPKKGIFVTDISLKELNTLYETRNLLEPYAILNYGNRIPQDVYLSYYQKYMLFLKDESVPYSYTEMDANFHRIFIDATENAYISSMYSIIESQISRTRVLTGDTSSQRRHNTIEEHLKIIQAALKNDWTEASKAATYHLQQSKNSVFNYLLKNDPSFFS